MSNNDAEGITSCISVWAMLFVFLFLMHSCCQDTKFDRLQKAIETQETRK